MKELDANPLDDKAQGEARAVVQLCKAEATIEDMHHCSGFLVTPVTRLNCLNEGACTPLPWSPDAVPNGKSQWFGWQKYSDTTDVQVAVVLQPWITTPDEAKRCVAQNFDKTKGLQQDPFILCLVSHMGGIAAKRALSCYRRNLQSPAKFSGCLEGVTLSPVEEYQINCVLGIHALNAECEKALHLTAKDAAQCTEKANPAQAQLADCIRKLPVHLPLAAQCAAAAGGDATMLGQCLKGAKSMAPKSTVLAIQTCVDAATTASKGDSSQMQIAVIKCATRHGAPRTIVDLYTHHQSMVSCMNDRNLDFDHRAECLRAAGLSMPATTQLSACVKASHTPLDAASCVNIPGIDNIRKAQQCFDNGAGSQASSAKCVANLVPSLASKKASCLIDAGNARDVIRCSNDQIANQLDQVQDCIDLAKNQIDRGKQCLAKLSGLPLTKIDLCLSPSKGVLDIAECAGVKGASIAKAAQACLTASSSDATTTAECLSGVAGLNGAKEALCMVKAHTGYDLLACTGDKNVAKVIAIKDCLNTDSDDYGKEALCMAAQVSLPPTVGHLLACAANSGTYEQGAACMISPVLSPQMAMALRCGTEAQGSPAGMAICMAGPSMNAELRIAAECAASTGGEPASFTACAGGRLTMKEIQQCISGGFKSDKGCFGPNNTIVRYFDAEEKVLRGVMRAAGLEHAYDNFLSDLHHGRLGKNNEIVKAINLIGMGSPDSVGRRFMQGFGLYGQLLIGGTVDLKATVAAAKTAFVTLVTSQLALVPSVTLGPDHIAVSLGNSGVNIQDGHVGGTIFGKHWSL